MWAVVVAEGLDIFWALRKGEGCLGGTGPVTAAIEGMGWEGLVSTVEKVVDRAIEGRRGMCQLTGTNGGSVTFIGPRKKEDGHACENGS
jgi:hypothetical protein